MSERARRNRVGPWLAAAVLVLATAVVSGARQWDRTTTIFVCGTDATSEAPRRPYLREHVVLAVDSRLWVPCPLPRESHTQQHVEVIQRMILRAGLGDPRLSPLVVQGYGRLGIRPPLELLRAVNPVLRREAASSLADAFATDLGDYVTASPRLDSEIANARDALMARLAAEPDDLVAATMLESLGRLPYEQRSDGTDEGAGIESFLVRAIVANPMRTLGAVRGLELLYRLRRTPPGPEAARALTTLLMNGPTGLEVVDAGDSVEDDGPRALHSRTRRIAAGILAAAGRLDTAALERVAQDSDWQVRRVVAGRVDWLQPDQRATGEKLLADPVFQVRYDALGPAGRFAATSHDCAPLFDHLDDREQTVALRAIDLVPAGCVDADEGIARIVQLATSLSGYESVIGWHKPARALAALTRLGHPAARDVVDQASRHRFWQVRAAAATAAGAVGDRATLVALSRDAQANVRTTVLEALGRTPGEELWTAAIAALDAQDFQLIRTAARLLRRTPEDFRVAATVALEGALARLTREAADPSRDPRVAIIQCLGEILPSGSAALDPYLSDFDPKVIEAAQAAIARLSPYPPSVMPPPRRRYPVQPTVAEVANTPELVLLRMESGDDIIIRLLPDVAPVTAARFADLVRSGFYDGKTFHRIVPNFVVQGGSPGANEYSGLPRYWRDEIGTAPHLRGAVGLSTRGRDTADGQIFIDLVDLPRLDHTYTVFGHVITGMQVVDRMLEGATIASATVK